MYQSTYTSPPTQPFSPPPDSYRTSPVSLPPKQPYTSAFSPPLMPPRTNGANGFSPIPSGQRSVYHPSGHVSRSAGSGRMDLGRPSQQAMQSGGYPQQPTQLPPAKHKGTLAPGQIVKVGEQAVRIERYLSEGGYAHVYLTTSDKPIYPPIKEENKKGRWGERGYTQHCLKRIAFQDEKVWTDVRKEIEVMKALPPNPHLTQYLGSAHSKLPSGGYEVFILMEFCAGGGIIDLLNKRLRDRLKEIEILNIFTDVCEAVAAMHALPRPLLHRDLKIENVLSHPSSAPPSSARPMPLVFKLCDFGSTTFPAKHPPSSKTEADALALDLNKHTTLQYRSPEMVEPMLGWAVGLPSDIWALGVLLYKLCYYTTPFEEHGTLAIVNAKYTFPQFPLYSPRLQHLIASMLVEHPNRRPNIFEVLQVAHEMSGTRPEVDYPMPSSRDFSSSTRPPTQPPPSATNLLDFTSASEASSTPVMQPSLASTVQPGRRGRPTRELSKQQITSMAQLSKSTASPPRSTSPGKNGSELSEEHSTSKSAVDAFGVPLAPLPKSPSGFGDNLAPAAASVQHPRLIHSPRPLGTGFDDSFAEARSPPILPGPSAISRTVSTSMRKSPDPSSSIPDSELSFEARFPSIEILHSGETSRPSRPVESRKRGPSLMGSNTGRGLGATHLPAESLESNMAPQPRSTQVTGTAFHSVPGGMLSPQAPNSTRTDLQSQTEVKENRPGVVPDLLMAGDAEESGSKQSLRPALVPNLSSSASRPLPRAPNGVASPSMSTSPTALKSPPNDVKVFNPEDLSGVAGGSLHGGKMEESSSDEDVGPEDPSGTSRLSVLSTRPQHRERDSSKPQDRQQDAAPSQRQPQKRGTTPASSVSKWRPEQRSNSGVRPRPQSMFVTPPTSMATTGSSSVWSPAEARDQVDNATGRASHSRPGHARQGGSINNMVSRYESLGVSAPATTENTSAKRKPSVASKPASLRKESTTIIGSIGSQRSSREAAKLTDPKPDEPLRPAQERGQPVIKPKPAVRGSASPVQGEKEGPAGRESPEKQQPVNLLIQRWNRGEVGPKG